MDPRDLREAFTAQIPDDHRWDARPKVKFVTDSPLEEAVKSEPVSEWANSLLAGKIQGIHPILACVMPICRRKSSKGQRLTSKIPYATEQGINSTVSGI
jgi:hypothetical protein